MYLSRGNNILDLRLILSHTMMDWDRLSLGPSTTKCAENYIWHSARHSGTKNRLSHSEHFAQHSDYKNGLSNSARLARYSGAKNHLSHLASFVRDSGSNNSLSHSARYSFLVHEWRDECEKRFRIKRNYSYTKLVFRIKRALHAIQALKIVACIQFGY